MTERNSILEGHSVTFTEGPAGAELLVDDSPVPITSMGKGYVLDQDAFGPVFSDPDALAVHFLKLQAIIDHLTQEQVETEGGE